MHESFPFYLKRYYIQCMEKASFAFSLGKWYKKQG